MPTLNTKLATDGQNLPRDARPRVRVGEHRYQQFEIDQAGHQLLIDGDTAAMEYLPVGRYRVWPLAEGYQYRSLGDDGVTILDFRDIDLVDGENPQAAFALEIVGTEAGFLGTYSESANLEYGFTSQGQPWQLRGYTAHLLPARVLQGRDIRPFIREAQSYGANTLITLGCHLSDWKVQHGFKFDPRTQEAKDAIVKMFDTGAEMGVRFAHGVAADFQYGLSDTEKRRIWDEQCEIADGRWNLLWRCGNEAQVNGWDLSLFPQKNLHGVLQSCGSNGENGIPFQSYRDWSEWEPRRSPWHKSLDDSGAGIFEQNNGYQPENAPQVGPFRCPIVAIEGIYFADTNPDHVGDARETDPQKALMVGLQMGASCAGGGVGTSRGLEGDLNGPVAAECARQQFRGMRAAFQR